MIKSIVRKKDNKTMFRQTGINESRLEVRVFDSGVGISSEDLQKVFDPLYSKKSFGVGLGLTLVKKIMEQLGGGIEITSEQGNGTLILLSLPLNNQDVDVKV